MDFLLRCEAVRLPATCSETPPAPVLFGQIRCYEISTCGVVEKLLADKDLSYVFNESDIGRLSKQLVLYHFSNGVCVVNSDSYFR